MFAYPTISVSGLWFVLPVLLFLWMLSAVLRFTGGLGGASLFLVLLLDVLGLAFKFVGWDCLTFLFLSNKFSLFSDLIFFLSLISSLTSYSLLPLLAPYLNL